MASIRRAKKLGTYKAIPYSKERARLLRETRASIEKTNKRLKSLSLAGYRGTWASKKLIARLDSKTINAWDKKRGKIKVNKQMTNTQLKAVQKASDQFLKSKTSTLRGIRETKANTIKAIKEMMSDENQREKVGDEDAEFYYDMFGDNDFYYFISHTDMDPSTLWRCIDEAIEKDVDLDGWLSILERYVTLNDLDLRERAIRLYEKYVI